ncbi:hypothetical protein QEG73_01150 [Chitinophagaceae bacterium 26-R-25]|nr:hypothetical protein [Chitinophagaceae bacterium 26-R-25]
MAQLTLQQQIALRKCLRSNFIDIDGIARAAILKKDMVLHFASGNPSLNSMQLTALQNAVASLHSATKTLLSALDRQKTITEPLQESLRTFLSKHEIAWEHFLYHDVDALLEMQQWILDKEPFPIKYISTIKRGLLQLSTELA